MFLHVMTIREKYRRYAPFKSIFFLSNGLNTFLSIIIHASIVFSMFCLPGALHEGSKVGIYACDPAAYSDPDWKELFNLIIQDYHTGNAAGTVKHPQPTFGSDAEIDSLGDLDPTGQFVVSTRVRVARSHAGMPFPPAAKKEVK